MAILYDTEHDLRERARTCISDDFKHSAIETAQEVFYQKRRALVEEMPDWEGLRNEAAAMRAHVTSNLDYYVREFAKNAEANGYIMHYAPTDEDALWEILDVFEQHGAASCVKSKSMMTEEIGLNDVLAEAGVRVTETDCAENILQTAGDLPSHIVVPALHLDREAIAEIYRKKRGYDGDSVPEHITHFLRKILREEFLTSEVGVRGCNFAVAETGSVTLVTNEGNGRMVDTFPKVQIIMVGIDRLVPDLESLDTMMALLPRSAVGSKITAYFTIDSGPRRAGEVDGPEEVHIVLMDNGRHKLLNTEFEPMLRCCRCGACLNICPVYRHITGHGYGSIYPGPMGIVLTAALEGYENLGGLANACTLCGACSEHCPVKIPLHELIRDHRINAVKAHAVSPIEEPLFSGAELLWSNVSVYLMAMRLGRPVMQAIAQGEEELDERSTWVPVLKGWTETRDFPIISQVRFRDWFREHERERAVIKTLEKEGDVGEPADGAASTHESDSAGDEKGGDEQ